MKAILPIIGCVLLTFQIKAQNPQIMKILDSLKSINKIVVDSGQNNVTGKQKKTTPGLLVTDKALNYFFADKIGSYLTSGEDLSLFTNYATLDATDGELSLNHNIVTKKNKDNSRIRQMLTIGFKANVSDGFASIVSNNKLSGELGLTAKYTFFHKGSMNFDNNTQETIPFAPSYNQLNHKQKMNIERVKIIEDLWIEAKEEYYKYKKTSNAISAKNKDQLNLPEVYYDTIQNKEKEEFEEALMAKTIDNFSKRQAEILSSRKDLYKTIRTSWTSLYAYIPITRTKYIVATDFLSNFSEKSFYPFEISATYTTIWETNKNGRFFAKIGAAVLGNNSIQTDDLENTDLGTYRNLGGTDTITLAKLEQQDAYIGEYKNFFTQRLQVQGVWFPNKLNIGISLYLEQFFGSYDPLNFKFGIPIRLNDKDGNPSVTFEIQARVSDISKSLNTDKKLSERTSYGISIGLPFTSIVN